MSRATLPRWIAIALSLAFFLFAMPPARAQQAPTLNPLHGIPVFAHPKQGVPKAGDVTVGGIPGAQLLYYGGAVMSNVQVVVVFWGPNVNATVKSSIGGFYQTITASPYYDMTTEYSTKGATVTGGFASSNQVIGRGTYLGSFTITPSVCPSNCTIDDTAIQPEILRQINAGKLPKPTFDALGDDNTLYMLYFPPGVNITQGGAQSCVIFCAYHGTAVFNTKNIAYGIMPDFGPGSGCDIGCGNGNQFQNVTSASSHEMIESVTDIGVGLAANFAPPLAWYDPQGQNGEIGDICNGDQIVASGFTVQLQWSNMQGACVDLPAKYLVSAPAAASSGSSFTLTLTAQDNTGATLTSYSNTVHFTSTDAVATLPPDFTFTPSNAGVNTFTVTLNTNGSQTITATDTVAGKVTGATSAIKVTTGSGTPAVTMTPATLALGSVLVGTTSASKVVTLKNSGTATLHITSIAATGNYASSTTCAATLAAAASCTISVTFKPTLAGAIPGVLTVTDDAASSPQALSLTGTGLGPLSVAPASLTYTSQAVGTTSAPKTVTLTNNSAGSLTIAFSASRDYAAAAGTTTPCGASLASKAKCTLAVTFSPKQNGAISGSVAITGAGFATQLVSATGTGTGGTASVLTFAPATLSFGNQLVGVASAAKVVTVTNSGASAVTISALSPSPEYTAAGSGTTPCSGSIPAAGKCTFSVTFTPSVNGSLRGSVAITNTSALNPVLYDVLGVGAPALTMAPATLTFAAQAVGTTSAPLVVTLTNNQAVALSVTGFTASGDYAAVAGGTTPCGASIAAKGKCTVQVTFHPTSTGAIPGVFTVTHGAAGSPQGIKMSGTGQ